MNKLVILCLLSFALCGCAKICEFGKAGDSSGLKCYKFLAQAEIGMSAKEVEENIGLPQKRQLGISYRGKAYDEAWVYNTNPPTVLYFKNGIMEHKEYQQ